MDDQDTPSQSSMPDNQPPVISVQQPAPETNPNNTVLNPHTTHSKKKLLPICISALVLLITLGIVGTIYYLSHHKTVSSKNATIISKTLIIINPDDTKIEQDLASIGNTLANYPSEGNSFSAPFIPDNINQLPQTKLNYKASSYSYKVIANDGGEKSNKIIYQICANFNKNTFNVSAYNNIFSTSGVDGTSADSYVVHSSRMQCFTNDISFMGQGLSLNLNNSEIKYKSQLQTN